MVLWFIHQQRAAFHLKYTLLCRGLTSQRQITVTPVNMKLFTFSDKEVNKLRVRLNCPALETKA